MIVQCSQREMQLDVDDVFPPASHLGFPRRPPWTRGMSKAAARAARHQPHPAQDELDANEKREFAKYIHEVLDRVFVRGD